MSVARHRVTPLLAVLAVAAFAQGGCSAANVEAQHTGRFDQRRPVVNVGTCCVGYSASGGVAAVYANDPSRKTLWLPVVDKSGTPYPAGHRHDAYFVGDQVRPFHSKRPARYRYRASPIGPAGRFNVQLASIWPDVQAVHFQQFDAHEDGRLTLKGTEAVQVWLKSKYGETATIKKLGEGGFSIAYRVCKEPRSCVVVKIRKMPPSFADWKRIKQAESAATELKRDLAVAEVADQATRWASYVDAQGKAVPLKINGKVLPPPAGQSAPPTRVARVAKAADAASLKVGVVEQSLIAFWPSDELQQAITEASQAGSAWRKSAMTEAGDQADVKAEDADGFFDMYEKPSRFGPEVIKAHRFFSHCVKFAKIPTIQRFCTLARTDFRIPDDFDERVQALEWMYRDTAADVILFTRANFGRALGNPAQDGEFREIGLDFNHGRNAGWDPATQQFVLFDY